MLLNELFGFGRKQQPSQTPSPVAAAPAARPAAPPQDPIVQEWSNLRAQLNDAIQAQDRNDPLRATLSQVVNDLNAAFQHREQQNDRGFSNMARQAAHNYLTQVRPSHVGTQGKSIGSMHADTGYISPAIQQLNKLFVPFLQKLQRSAVR